MGEGGIYEIPLRFCQQGKEPLMRPGRVLTDIEQSEHLPLATRLAARSTYELLQAAAEEVLLCGLSRFIQG